MAKTYKHKELEVKSRIFELAKELSLKDDFPSQLSATILFINLADYLALSVYEHLKAMVEESTKKYYLGDVTLNLKPRKKILTLGEVTAELEQFDFPKKTEMIELLNKVNSARKPVVHHMVKTPYKDMQKIDKAIYEICSNTEQLVNVVDEIFTIEIPQIVTLLDVSGVSSSKKDVK